MELKDYTTEELKAELRRRAEDLKAERKKSSLRCRNCKHCEEKVIGGYAHVHKCMARTWGKTFPRHYTVRPSTKACELFERKGQ